MGKNIFFIKVLHALINLISVNCNTTISDENNNLVIPLNELEWIDLTTSKLDADYDVQSKLVLDFFDKDVLQSDISNTTLSMLRHITLKAPTRTTQSDMTRTTKKLPKKTTLTKKFPKKTTLTELKKTRTTTNILKFIGVTSPKISLTQKTTLERHNSIKTSPRSVESMKSISVTRATTQPSKTTPRKVSSLCANCTVDDLNMLVRAKLKEKGITTPQETSNPTTLDQGDEKDTDGDDLKTILKTKLKEQAMLNIGPFPRVNDDDIDLDESMKTNLSCILCDNVSNKDCNNPKHKLLPVIRCSHVTDICYTMQTPFGIVDRGCYNPFKNHATYVCSCNLCNSIPIHDLPHTFKYKKEWLFDVEDLSHVRRLRKSIYSKITCVHCEVNQTIDDVPDIDCLQGKFKSLPFEECDTDEICGIRSIRGEGYIWRGCLRIPRYNYLWRFCKTDLCNFDPPTSVFDIE